MYSFRFNFGLSVSALASYVILQFLIGFEDSSPFGTACHAPMKYARWTIYAKFLEVACLISLALIFCSRSVYHRIWKQVFVPNIIMLEIVALSVATCVIVFLYDWGGICGDVLK